MVVGLCLLAVCAAVPRVAQGYDPEVHQQLTFQAARWVNRCAEGAGVPALTPLEVRLVANSNMGLADTNALVRLFRWSYFDPAGRDDRRWLWLVRTRFTEHFGSLVSELASAQTEVERYRELGRIVSYIQLVSEPARAIPVYAARFWRWNFRDGFERFHVDPAALHSVIAAGCDVFEPPPQGFADELEALAADTVAAVRAPIRGLPTTWEAFWRVPKRLGEFGEYGVAGNSFGQRVVFDCGDDGATRCLLVDDDPLYVDFATSRQAAAVRATARALWLMQTRYGIEGPPPVETP